MGPPRTVYIDQAVPPSATRDDLSDVLDYAVGHLGDDLEVDDFVARAHMSRRTFDRRFRSRLGTSPHQWLLHQRILHAQRLLEDTDRAVDAVAAAAGFATAITMRPHFRRFVGISPQSYRRNYRSP